MTSRATSARPLSARLIGTWELLSREDHTRNGDRRIDPSLGADPVALLTYDGSGHFAAQFMKRDTQTLTGALSPENVGEVLARAMTVDGDELLIRLGTTAVTGEPVTRTLRWRRVG